MNFPNMPRMTIKFFVIVIIGFGAASLLIYLNLENLENVSKVKSFSVKFKTLDEYNGEEVKKIKTENPFANQIIMDCGIEHICTIEALQNLAQIENKETILKTVNDIVYTYNKVGFFCHQQAHHLGEFMMGLSGNLSMALSYSDQKCGGSVIHGVLQNFVSNQVFFNKEKIEDMDIINICPKDESNQFSLTRWQCIHGLGHGLTIAYDYKIFSAVNRCDDFDFRWEELSCSKGAFMENMVLYYDTKEGDFDKDDIFYPCNVVNQKYAPACYHYQTLYMNDQRSTSAWNDGYEVCDKIEPQEFIKYCYYGMGKELAYSVYDNLNMAISPCQKGDPQYHANCFNGLLLTLVNGWGTDHAFEYCKLLPIEFKTGCYDSLGKWIHMLFSTNSDREKECLKAEGKEYSTVCMQANLDNLKLL